MTEWWTYGLSDFLMFSPEAYWRLVARHNAAWWPAQCLGVAAALALPVLAHRRATRAVLVLLAIAWAWAGWAFHWRIYAEIFLAAPWVAAAFGVEALLLLLAGALPGRQDAVPVPAARAAGFVLLAAALAYPLLAPLTGHPWMEAEVFGFLPDPTAVATVGALLVVPGLPRWTRVLLAVVPLLSLLLGAATRYLIA